MQRCCAEFRESSHAEEATRAVPARPDQTKCFHVRIGSKQHRLSPGEAEARRLYHELMAKPPEVRQPAVSAAPPTLVVEILDAFLDWVDRNKAARTYAWSTGFQTATDWETSFPAGSPNPA